MKEEYGKRAKVTESLDQAINRLEKKVIDALVDQSIEPNLKSADLQHHRQYVAYTKKISFFRSLFANLFSLSALIYGLISANVWFLYWWSKRTNGLFLEAIDIVELFGLVLAFILPSLLCAIGLVWQFIRVGRRSNHRLVLITATLAVISQIIFSILCALIIVDHQSSRELYKVNLSEDGNEFRDVGFGGLVLDGRIGPKSYESLLSFYNGMDINTIVLNSKGGDIDSAIAISRWISKNNIPILVKDSCMSTCVIIAVSGSVLYASKSARFGFNQGVDNSFKGVLNRKRIDLDSVGKMELELRQHGVPEKVLLWVQKTPIQQMHFITTLDLKRLGVVDVILDF